MSKKLMPEAPTVDAEIVEEVAQEAPVELPPRCEIVAGMDADGNIYFNVRGTDQNLILMSGLKDYMLAELKKIWNQRVGA